MITVQVKQNIFNKGAAYIPDVVEYTGAIIPNPKWVGADSICLTTGDITFPFRIINKANIVSSSVAITYNAPKSNRNVFQAKGNKGNIYTITREGTNWSCTCVGFGFRRDCRHVNAAKKFLDRST
jgi:hypothetical protein